MKGQNEMVDNVVKNLASPRGNYPHFKQAGDFVYVSGISSRRQDQTFDGASVDSAGAVKLDVRAQTRAVLDNIRTILASAGLALQDLVQVTSYLVDMNDFQGYNEVYGEFFSQHGPTRTTVAVHQLPHPHILIEMSGVAFKPVNGG
jgi:2-aminomuconate deaminase